MTTVTSTFAELTELLELQSGDAKHEPAATSTLDIVWTLYDRVLRVDPGTPDHPDRDRFLLSKGHGPQAYYAVLAAKGFFPVDWLPTFGAFDSPLGHHPDRMLVPGVEFSSGSLGHGLPVAVGTVLGLRAAGNHRPRVFCMIGDGELDEGSNHEAIAVAGRLSLDRLTAIVVDNRSSSLGWPGGIATRFEAEGWAATVVDGRDHDALAAALLREHSDRPSVVVAEVTR